MATTKRMPAPPKTQAAVQKLIAYIVNPAKTTGETAVYVDSLSGSIPSAAQEFKECRERWGKTAGNFAYHFEQSFKPGETTPDMAHECGAELARSLFGEEYQVVFATHLDRDHIHNHFAVCAVNLKDGHKLQTDHDFIRRMRAENDRICREHGLSVVDEPKKGGGKSYAEWLIDKNGGFTWRGQIREDIDSLIPEADTLKELLDLLTQRGYTVKGGAHISVSPPGTNTNFRLYKLGDGYSPEELAARIGGLRKRSTTFETVRIPKVYHYRLRGTFPLLRRRGGLRGLYFVYLYRLRRIMGQPVARQQRYSYNCRKDTRQVLDFAADLRLLSEHKIQTMEELAVFAQKIRQLQKGLHKQRSALRSQLGRADTPEAMTELYRQIEDISGKLRKLSTDMKTCNRISQRSQTIRANEIEILQTEKGEILDGSRSRSNGYSPALNNGGR